MSNQSVIIIISFCLGLTGAILGGLFTVMMIGEVNRRRGESQLISCFWFTPMKAIRVLRAYRQAYPAGRLHIYLGLAVALLFLGWLGAVLASGIL